METPPTQFIAAHPDLSSWVITGLLFVLVGAFIYYVNKSDKNNENQWTVFTDHAARISKLEGRCEVNHP